MPRVHDRPPALLIAAFLLVFFGLSSSSAASPPAPPSVGTSSSHFEVVDARTLPLQAWVPSEAALRSVRERTLANALGLDPDSNLVELRRNVDAQDNLHIRYQQTYRGIPIWGQHVVVHADRRDNVWATGRVIRRLDRRVRSQGVFRIRGAGYSADDALAIARLARGHTDPGWQLQRESVEPMILVADGDTPREVHVVEYYAETDGADPTRPFVLVDARSGEVVAQWEGLSHAHATGPGGTLKTGRYVFGTDLPHLDVTQSGATCTMETARVRTVNLNHRTTGTEPFSFTCPDNRIKEINGAFSPLNDAHFFGGVAHDMYVDWVGRPPLSFQLILRVHYGVAFENAFWDGIHMTFGDGAARLHPLVDVNIVAHEISHGFTEQNSNLIYAAQSGGINEAFSDIAGEATEFYWRGSVDWLNAGAIAKLEPGLRYFEDPTRDRRSIGHASDYRQGMDVHFSSGVFNRAFFLLANTAGWTVRSAFEVFAHANQNQWGPNETFQTAACGVLESAKALHRNVREADAAFQTVGVDCGYLPFVDEDGDRMDDSWEISHGLDPTDPADATGDTDGDGLPTLGEYLALSDPADPDTDDDGLTDGAEVHDHRTNPADTDTDGDGVPDGAEVGLHETDPLDADTDDDGLRDGDEVGRGTDPHAPDTDGDGMADAFEVAHGFDPTADDGAASRDADGDALTNLEEFVAGTNPARADTDSDDLSDAAELRQHGTDPRLPDTDGDRMTDGWEIGYGLDPLVDDASGDLDGDGSTNFAEFQQDEDPTDPESRPIPLDAWAIGWIDDVPYRIDLISGAATPIGGLGESGAFRLIEGMAFTPDGALYAVTYFGRTLRVDPVTGRATLVGSPGVGQGEKGLAGDELGMLWMVSLPSSSLYRVDPATGAATSVGSLGVSGLDSLAWDGFDFYAIQPATGNLYRIDRTSGAATLVGPIAGVPMGLQTGLTTDARGRLWGISRRGDVFLVDKQTAAATPVSTTFPNFRSIALDTFPDEDGDGMPGFWERTYGLADSDPSDAALDPDRDGLTNLEEFTASANPRNPDTDGDDLMDGEEVSAFGTDPARLDSDADGISDGSEVYVQHTDPRDTDSDGDGMHDRWEVIFHFDPLVDDAAGDADADGATNLEEFLGDSHPRDFGSRPIGLRGYTLDRGNQLHRVDLITGRTTPIGPLGITADVESMAISPSHELYAISDGSPSALYRVDPTTGAATRIGATGVTADGTGLEFDDQGTLWMVGTRLQSLYQVNTSTGRATRMAVFGQPAIHALASDGESLFGLSSLDDGLYRIDRTTGQATLVGPLVHVSLNGRTGMTADARRRLWALDGTSIFRVDAATGRATRVSSLAGDFTNLALDPFPGAAALAPAQVPALPAWGIALLVALLAASGRSAVRRRR